MTVCFTAKPLLKRFYYIRKEFAPAGSKFFLYSIDTFSEGDINNFDRDVSLESVPIPLKILFLHKLCGYSLEQLLQIFLFILTPEHILWVLMQLHCQYAFWCKNKRKKSSEYDLHGLLIIITENVIFVY